MVKLVLTDLDDTLIPVGAPCASARARKAIHRLLSQGIHFGPVSGRIPSAMGWMFAGDEACFRTGAFSNGQIIRIDGEVALVKELPYAALCKVEDILDDEGGAALAIYETAGDGNAVLYSHEPEQVRQDEVLFSEASGDVAEDLDPAAHYVKANVHISGSYERRCRVRDRLRREVPELGFVFPNMNAPLIDISPAGWDKGSAVHALADALHIGYDEVVCFGDSENDLAMIESVPNGVAVANASEEIQDAARWHIGASAEDAVAQAMEDIAHAAETGEMPAFMRG